MHLSTGFFTFICINYTLNKFFGFFLCILYTSFEDKSIFLSSILYMVSLNHFFPFSSLKLVVIHIYPNFIHYYHKYVYRFIKTNKNFLQTKKDYPFYDNPFLIIIHFLCILILWLGAFEYTGRISSLHTAWN